MVMFYLFFMAQLRWLSLGYGEVKGTYSLQAQLYICIHTVYIVSMSMEKVAGVTGVCGTKCTRRKEVKSEPEKIV